MRRIRACLLAITVGIGSVAGEVAAAAGIDFAEDIRPIFAEHCFRCHGPDEAARKADLRLDVRVTYDQGPLRDQLFDITGGHERSALFRRITSQDPDLRMPPVEEAGQLTPAEVALIAEWLDEGAKWNGHWAYERSQRAKLPTVADAAWPRNAIDYFTLAKMKQHGLLPAASADKRTLIRRVTFDITGLPPTLAEIEAFLADSRDDAYERLIDRLLASPRYGERMAVMWLDLARYADTHGYHMDAHRDMWRWRDWVIAAYNDNMPFDQFTIEQLAGDLLPNATLAQRIATGFNRNNMINFENGIIAEEYRNQYVVDRVVTTSTVWLGQTMVCAQCHDHKYDPFTQRDFYRLYAFFNNVPENGVDGDKGNAIPFIKAPTRQQAARLDQLQARAASLAERMRRRAKSIDTAFLAWASRKEKTDTRKLKSRPVLHLPLDESPEDSLTSKLTVGERTVLAFNRKSTFKVGDRAAFESDECFTIGVWLFPTSSSRMVVLGRCIVDAADRGYCLELDDGNIRFRIVGDDNQSLQVDSESPLARSKWQHVAVTYGGTGKADAISVLVNGKPVAIRVVSDELRGSIVSELPFRIGDANREESFRGMMDDLRVYDTLLDDDEIAVLAGADPIHEILTKAPEQRTADEKLKLKSYYLDHVDAVYKQLRSQLAELQQQLEEVEAAVPTTMVMQELPEPRGTHVLERGRYDLLGELVEPGVPSILPPLTVGARPTRLDLARWLVDRDHPLTARVAVNHLWQQFFDQGIVQTPEDFGTRGQPPTHPLLLDWLATKFSADWDVKRLVKLIVTSATYRQASDADPPTHSLDPENRWLARASSLQRSAEMIRDNALAVSGLLVERTGGPSVFPYQPAGLWEEISYNPNDFTAQVFRQSRGEDLYRRSLYTFWKRSLPSPTLAAFNAPSRDVCVVRRPRTTTVQQALVLMNDPTFVEASRAFAERVLRQVATTDERVVLMFQLAAGRHATARELDVLSRLTTDLLHEYREDTQRAERLIAVGDLDADSSFAAVELAAWTNVASVILSLDEVITRN